jgi:hypothetical protein
MFRETRHLSPLGPSTKLCVSFCHTTEGTETTTDEPVSRHSEEFQKGGTYNDFCVEQQLKACTLPWAKPYRCRPRFVETMLGFMVLSGEGKFEAVLDPRDTHLVTSLGQVSR